MFTDLQCGPWLLRSPDLTSIDIFLWGYMKELVYGTPVDSQEDLIARISVSASHVQDVPGIFKNVRTSMLQRCQACIDAGGQNFEHLLRQ